MDRKMLKKRAFELRKKQYTYSLISEELGIAKSTLSYWFKRLPSSIHQSQRAYSERWAKIQKMGALANKVKRSRELQEITSRSKDEVSTYPLNNKGVLASLLSMLYWAEGAKSPLNCGVKFANTDPKLIALFMKLLRTCYSIKEERLRVRLHLHYYHKIKEARKFWSDLSNIPQSQFYKIYIKPRSKTKRMRKNFKGICFVYYCDGDLKHEIIQKAYIIQDLICKSP